MMLCFTAASFPDLRSPEDKTELSKIIERKKIAQEMFKYIEDDLNELGYDDIEAELLLTDFKKTNSFNNLPDEVKGRYKMLPYVCQYELTDEIKNECEQYINDTIEMWENLDTKNLKEYPPRSFTKIQKNGKKVLDFFYCGQLCSHGKVCPYLHDFLDMLDAEEDDEDDMFS